MREYLGSKLVRVGLVLLIVGSGPLLGIIVAASLGLWPDPNPNPVGPGLLFFFTFWPAVICLVVGGSARPAWPAPGHGLTRAWRSRAPLSVDVRRPGPPILAKDERGNPQPAKRANSGPPGPGRDLRT